MSWRNWGLVVGILGSVVGVGIVSFAGATSLGTKSYDPSIMASWVQAVGSVGAILGAVWVAKHQQGIEAAKRRNAILAVAKAAVVRADEIAANLECNDPRYAMSVRFHRSITDGVTSAMSAVPMHEIGMPNSIIAFASLRDQVGFLAYAVEQFLAGPWQHKDMKKALQEAREYFANEPTKFQDLYAQNEEVLAGNVRIHVQVIHREFAILERELAPPH